MNIFKNLPTVAAGAIFITLGAIGAAQAVTVAGSSSGVFGTPDPGSNSTPTVTGVGTNKFSWGSPFSTTAPPNSLSFAGNAFSAETESLFKVGDLTYFNGTTAIGTTVASVPLNVSLAMSSPTSISKVFDFDFDLTNTPNTGTPEQNADFVYPINSFASSSFELAGVNYTLQLTGFSKDGGATIIDRFNVLEDGTDTAAVYGKVTSVPTPGPVSPPTAEIPFEFSPSLGILLLGAWGAIAQLNSLVQKRKSSGSTFSKN